MFGTTEVDRARKAVAVAERKLARTTGACPNFKRWSAIRQKRIADRTAELGAAVLQQGLAEYREDQDIASRRLGYIALTQPLMKVVAKVLEDAHADWNELGDAGYASWLRAMLNDLETMYGVKP